MRPRVGVRDVFDEFAMVDAYTAEPVDLALLGITPGDRRRRRRRRAGGPADPVTDKSPHLCRSTRPIDGATRAVPLLPPIDQSGYVPFPVRRLTPHSLSRPVRDLLAGDLCAHREYPVDPDDEYPPAEPAPDPAERGVYSQSDWQRGWERRRADLADMAGISAVLTDVEQRADELNRRAAALLCR